MLAEDIVWGEEHAIGVEAIDSAHQEFFRILRRLMMLSHNKSKHQWVAEEGIKYLKQYAIRHFQNEEEYMRSIGYVKLEQHREQHETMRTKILPKIESQLRHERFSEEALEKFLTIMRLWLTRHIMVHDKAIGWATICPESA